MQRPCIVKYRVNSIEFCKDMIRRHLRMHRQCNEMRNCKPKHQITIVILLIFVIVLPIVLIFSIRNDPVIQESPPVDTSKADADALFNYLGRSLNYSGSVLVDLERPGVIQVGEYMVPILRRLAGDATPEDGATWYFHNVSSTDRMRLLVRQRIEASGLLTHAIDS